MSQNTRTDFGRLKDSDQAHQRHPQVAEADQWDLTDDFDGESGVLFEQAMAQTRMAVCLTDPHAENHPIVFANRAFRELTGYSKEEIVGKNCRFLQGPETDRSKVALIKQALDERRVVVVEMLNYRKDGTTFWNALHLGPIYDAEGRLVYYFGSQWDVTDVHIARAEQSHAKAMSREISHRMKNMFAVIGGIVSVTGRAMKTPDVAQRINERIQALGRAYEPTLDEASFGTIEVGQAIRAVLRPYDPEENRIRFTGNGLRTDPNVVSVIGLTLHELATNATKYGALSDDKGCITVNWDHRSDRHGRQVLVIEWQEDDGPPVAQPITSSGTGFDIVETLLRLSNGTLDREWHRDGLRAVVTLPIGSKESR